MSFNSNSDSSDEDLFAPQDENPQIGEEQLSDSDEWEDEDEYIQASDSNSEDKEIFEEEDSNQASRSKDKRPEKKAHSSRAEEEEGGENVDGSDEEGLPDDPKGYQFNASQVAYLKTRLQQYREASAKRRETLVSMSVKTFASEMYAISGKKLSQKRKGQLKKASTCTIRCDQIAVTNWFKGRLEKYQTKAKKSVWGGRYYGQLVFKRERTRIVQYLADILVRKAPIPDLRRLIDHEQSFLGKKRETSNSDDDDDDDEGPSHHHTKQTPEGFTKFQTAASMLWKALSAKERKEYDRKAKAWKEATPPVEQQRKAAERMGSKRLMQFAEGALHEMNARLYMLVAFEKVDGRPIAFDFELSGGNAGANGQAFRDLYDDQLKEMGLLELWKDFAADVYLDPLEQEDERRGKRVAKKALMKFKRNEYGEPIIPEASERPGTEQRAKWLARFLRSYMTIHYNIARGNPTGRTPVPWRRLALNIRRFISPSFLPDHLAEILQEPSLMTSNEREALYKFFLRRQRKGDVDNIFEFKSIWDGKSKTYKPCHPRTLASEYPSDYYEDEDSDEVDDGQGWQLEDVVASPRQESRATAKKAGSGSARQDGDVGADDEEEDEDLFPEPAHQVQSSSKRNAKAKSSAPAKGKSTSKSKSQSVEEQDEGEEPAAPAGAKAKRVVGPKRAGKDKSKEALPAEPQSQTQVEKVVASDQPSKSAQSASSKSGMPQAKPKVPPRSQEHNAFDDEEPRVHRTSTIGISSVTPSQSRTTSKAKAKRKRPHIGQDSQGRNRTDDESSDGEIGSSSREEETPETPGAESRKRSRLVPVEEESEDDEDDVDELPRVPQTRAKTRRAAAEPVTQPPELRRSSRPVKARKLFGEDYTPAPTRASRPPRSAQRKPDPPPKAKRRAARSIEEPPAKRTKVEMRSSTTARQKAAAGTTGARKQKTRSGGG